MAWTTVTPLYSDPVQLFISSLEGRCAFFRVRRSSSWFGPESMKTADYSWLIDWLIDWLGHWLIDWTFHSFIHSFIHDSLQFICLLAYILLVMGTNTKKIINSPGSPLQLLMCSSSIVLKTERNNLALYACRDKFWFLLGVEYTVHLQKKTPPPRPVVFTVFVVLFFLLITIVLCQLCHLHQLQGRARTS